MNAIIAVVTGAAVLMISSQFTLIMEFNTWLIYAFI
jgi:hypothetical protein